MYLSSEYSVIHKLSYGKKRWCYTTKRYTGIVHNTETCHFYDELDDNKIVYYRGLHTSIMTFIAGLMIHGIVSSVDSDVNVYANIQLTDKWKDILRTYQLEDILKILTYKGALAQLPTAYGKTELLLAITESFKTDANILIMCPSNEIKTEIKSRAEMYEIAISDDYDSDCRIWVINPKGMCSTTLYKEGTHDKWLSNVELCITDECHTMPAASWLRVLTRMRRLTHSYGVSATISPNIEMPTIDTLTHCDVDVLTIVSYCGPVVVDKTPIDLDKSLIVKSVEIDLSINDDPEDAVKAYKSMTTSPQYFEVMSWAISNHPEYIYFIPVSTRRAGELIYEHLTAQGYPGIMWNAGQILPDHLTSQLDIKQEFIDKSPRYLIATSLAFQGINIPEITGAILSFGRSPRGVLQPLGRAGRTLAGIPMAINVIDTSNTTMKSQGHSRRRLIRSSYKIDKYIRVRELV